MPVAGVPVEVTPPDPTWVRVNTFVVIVNVAVTLFAAVIGTVHVVAEPVHVPPLQPVNTHPTAGLSVSTTEVL